tara:strand:+ start:1627 stop:2160 length:534 start_codon:yes stop_codon:yes gene_type:complete
MSYKRTEAQRLITKYGIPEASSMLSNKEDNDCVVRAVSHAFDVDYIKAHHFCEMKLHRKSGEGTYTSRYLPKVKQAFGSKIKQLGKFNKYSKTYRYLTRDQKSKVERWSNAKQKYVFKREIKQVEYKVCEFIKAHSEGRYLVTVKGHMFALIDGVIKGNWNDNKRLTRKVKSAYRVC